MVVEARVTGTPMEKAPEPPLGTELIPKERYVSQGVHGARVGAHVDEGLECRGAGAGHPQRGGLLHDRAGARVVPDRAGGAGQGASVLQRLPPPREPDPQPRHGPRRELPVRLPLLRVQPRRLEEVRAGRGHLHPGRSPGDGPDRDSLRHLGGLGLVQHEPGRGAARGVPGRAAGAHRPVSLREDVHRPGQDHRVGHQLEGLGGRLQRGLPRAGHPSADCWSRWTTSTCRSTCTSGTTATWSPSGC